jgi:hypothetical protein
VSGGKIVSAAIFNIRRAELAVAIWPFNSLATVNGTNLERR